MLTLRIPNTFFCRALLPTVFLLCCAWMNLMALTPEPADQQDQPATDSRKVISLSVHGIPSLSFPSPDIEPYSTTDLNNIAASAQYKLDNRHSVGIEVGRENYPQEFEVKFGRTIVRYEQNWTGWYYALAYENLSDPWESMQEVHHFFRVALGGNKTGPLMRLSGGLNWRVNSTMSVGAGVDLSMSTYKASSLWNSTQKVGMRFGLNVDM